MPLRRIIPCMDIRGGSVVKGSRFEHLRYAGEPVVLSSRYEEEGADEVVWLDITATNDSRRMMFGLLRDTSSSLTIPVTAGGGIGSIDDISAALSSGADKVSINTAAVRTPSLVAEASAEFGRQCIVVSIDAAWNESAGRYEVYTNSGRVNTGLDAVEWARRVGELGAGEIMLTSKDRDGTTSGYDCRLTYSVASSVSLPVIASGGCGSPDDMAEVLLSGGADAALAASIFHYGHFTVREAKEMIHAKGVPLRMQGVHRNA